jgi:hypothetical protein
MKFTELTLGDMAAFRARVEEQRESTRKRRAERLMEDAKTLGDVGGKEILELLDRPLTEADYEAHAETIDGVIYMAYLSLKHHHTDIGEDDVKELISVSDTESVVAAMLPEAEKKSPKTPQRKRSRGVLPSHSSSGGTKGQSNGTTSGK